MKRCSLPQVLSLAILVAALLLEGCSTSGASSSNGNDQGTPTPLPTTAALSKPTYPVQRGEVIGTARLSGRLAPVDQRPLFFSMDGRIRNVYVGEGYPVEVGTVIADLEGVADIQRQLELSQIRLQRNQIDAQIAQLNFDIFISQTSKGSANYNKRLAIEQLQLELANLSVQEASLGLQDLEDSLAKTQLVSPMDGEITSLGLSPGSQIHAYNTVGRVADPSQMEVSATTTDISVVGKVEVGMLVTILPASGTGQPLTGVVRRLPVTGSDVQEVERDNTVRISLDSNPVDAGYKLNDMVSVTVILVKREDVLWVPPQTVRTFSGRTFVVVQEGDVQRRMDVKVGVIGEDRVEILEGLTEGQVVVSP